MARKLTYNCEVGETQTPQGESGKIKPSETSPIEGKRSFEIPAAAPTTEAHRASWTVASATLPAGANNRNYYVRVYWRNEGDPSADVTLVTWGNLKEGRYGELIHLKNGKLQLKRNGSTVVGESAAKVPIGVRYVEMRLLFGSTTSNGQLEGRLDGESFAVNNATNLGAGLSYDELRVGVCNSTGGPGGLVQRLDGIALNDDSGEKDASWVGAFKVSEPPAVVTGKAEGIGGAIAALHGTVNPKGLPTGYWFEYGTTKSYGSKTAESEAGDGEKAVAVEAALKGLSPETTYHFRLVAKNEIGESAGVDATFETGAGPSHAAVSTAFAADHETKDLSEYGSSGTFRGALSVVESPPGYGDGQCLKAEVTEPDGFSRGIATKAQTGWKIGQEVRWGGAFFLPKGFFAAKQGQIDIFRWDNFDQDEATTERSGLVFSTSDTQLRLVRIKEGEPDEQVTLNLGSGEELLGPVISEGRWHWAEVRQVLWHEDSLALNELWVDGAKVSSSTRRNCSRSDLVVSRFRVGIAATNGKQTNGVTVYVDRIRSGPMPLVGALPPPSRVAVSREFPPDKLAVRIADPKTDATIARWAEDEAKAENVIGGLTKGGEMPGGPKESGGSLARDPRVDWPDLETYFDYFIENASTEKLWEGRITQKPESDGERMVIEPKAVGHQAALEDRQALIGPGFIDCDLSKWGDPSTQRKLDLGKANLATSASVSAGGQDAGSTAPGFVFDFTGVTATEGPIEGNELWYYGGGVDIGALLFDFVGDGTSPWSDGAELAVDDLDTIGDPSTNYNGTSAANQVLTATAPGRKYALLRAFYLGTYVGQMSNRHLFTNPKIVGRQGLALQGEWPKVGFTAKQMLEYAIPLYTYLRVEDEAIEDDGYVIPQAWFSDPGSMATVVKELTKYGLLDWFVKHDKLFEIRFPGTYGRNWQAYAGPSELKGTGEDGQRLWDRIVVRYQDVDRSTRTVGWPGSGANTESEALQITDPDHPAVKAEYPREDLLDLRGISTPERALEAGERWLAEANELPNAGTATLRGYISDDKSVMRPVSQVEEGDWIRFPDAGSKGTGYRKIVAYSYDHETRTCEVNLDAPPEAIQALLERMQADLSPLALS